MVLSKVLMIVGAAILLLGVVLHYAPWLINWFGKLPGDIRIQNEHSFVFIPLTSMILISVILTLIVNLLFRK